MRCVASSHFLLSVVEHRAGRCATAPPGGSSLRTVYRVRSAVALCTELLEVGDSQAVPTLVRPCTLEALHVVNLFECHGLQQLVEDHASLHDSELSATERHSQFLVSCLTSTWRVAEQVAVNDRLILVGSPVLTVVVSGLKRPLTYLFTLLVHQ